MTNLRLYSKGLCGPNALLLSPALSPQSLGESIRPVVCFSSMSIFAPLDQEPQHLRQYTHQGRQSDANGLFRDVYGGRGEKSPQFYHYLFPDQATGLLILP